MSGEDFVAALFPAVLLLLLPTATDGIGCYVCTSMNGDNPYCDDPFNTTFPEMWRNFIEDGQSNNAARFFQDPCMTGRKERNGLFPASVCVKLKGEFIDSTDTILVRTCSLDSNSLTMDTEIARVESSCGVIDFAGPANWSDRPPESSLRRMRGCISVCDSVDGCNGGSDFYRGFASNGIRVAVTMVVAAIAL